MLELQRSHFGLVFAWNTIFAIIYLVPSTSGTGLCTQSSYVLLGSTRCEEAAVKYADQSRCCLSCLPVVSPLSVFGLWALARSHGSCEPLSQDTIGWRCTTLVLLQHGLAGCGSSGGPCPVPISDLQANSVSNTLSKFQKLQCFMLVLPTLALGKLLNSPNTPSRGGAAAVAVISSLEKLDI